MHGTIELDNRRVCACGGPKNKDAKRCLACANAAKPARKGSPICQGCGGTKSYLSHRYCLRCYTAHVGEPCEPAYISPWVEDPDGIRSRYVTGGVVGPSDVYAMRLRKGRRRKTVSRPKVKRWIGTTIYLRPIGPPNLKIPFALPPPTPPVGSLYPTVQRIIETCAVYCDISVEDIISDKRDGPIIRARHMAIYLAKKLTLRSLPDIGRRFGGRDHTTCLSAVRKVTRLMEEDGILCSELERLEAFLTKRPDDDLVTPPKQLELFGVRRWARPAPQEKQGAQAVPI